MVTLVGGIVLAYKEFIKQCNPWVRLTNCCVLSLV